MSGQLFFRLNITVNLLRNLFQNYQFNDSLCYYRNNLSFPNCTINHFLLISVIFLIIFLLNFTVAVLIFNFWLVIHILKGYLILLVVATNIFYLINCCYKIYINRALTFLFLKYYSILIWQ